MSTLSDPPPLLTVTVWALLMVNEPTPGVPVNSPVPVLKSIPAMVREGVIENVIPARRVVPSMLYMALPCHRERGLNVPHGTGWPMKKTGASVEYLQRDKIRVARHEGRESKYQCTMMDRCVPPYSCI